VALNSAAGHSWIGGRFHAAKPARKPDPDGGAEIGAPVAVAVRAGNLPASLGRWSRRAFLLFGLVVPVGPVDNVHVEAPQPVGGLARFTTEESRTWLVLVAMPRFKSQALIDSVEVALRASA
jgi:hypothetical protein